MEVMDVIRARRSTRSFKPDAVSNEILAEILEAGRLAPSPGNSQGWYFGVIRDEQVRRQLAHAAGNQTWIAGAPVMIALCAQVDWHLHPPAEDDFGLQVCLTRYGADFWIHLHAHPDPRRTAALLGEGMVSLAGQHMVLAAVNHGLGACWVGYLDVDKASAILGLPENVVCQDLLPIGYPAEAPEPIERRSLDDVVFTNRWQPRRSQFSSNTGD